MLKTLVMNTIGPFVIWKTQRIPAICKFEAVSDDQFIKEVSNEYRALAESLEELGFDTVGSSILKESESDTFFRLYWDAEKKTVATCVCGKSALGEINYIEFSQQYADGSVLDVSNNPVPGLYPKLDIKMSYRFPSVTHANELLEIFCKLKMGIKSSSAPIDYDVKSGFRDIELFMRRESDELAQKGIVKREIDEDGKRALTLYGAIYLTYRAISPGKNIVGYITKRQAKKVLSRVQKVAESP